MGTRLFDDFIGCLSGTIVRSETWKTPSKVLHLQYAHPLELESQF